VKVNDEVLSRTAKIWSSSSDGDTTSWTTIARAEGTEFLPKLAGELKDRGIVKLPTSLREIPREIKLQEWEGQVHRLARLTSRPASSI
jgi:hypothetical protein